MATIAGCPLGHFSFSGRSVAELAEYYITFSGSASLQDTHLLGEFGGTVNAMIASPRKQPGPATGYGVTFSDLLFLKWLTSLGSSHGSTPHSGCGHRARWTHGWNPVSGATRTQTTASIP